MNLTLLLSRGGAHLRARALWLASFGAVAMVTSLSRPAPVDRSAPGVAGMLGSAVGGEVGVDDFVWEGRGGFFTDTFFGRSVLFVARHSPSGPGDVYRARVRLTRDGRPLSLRLTWNLTGSPLGDDHALVAQGHHAAFVTSAYGAVQGVTLLDLDGESDLRDVRVRRGSDRVATAVDRWLATGALRGTGRTEITFAAPPPVARVELQGDTLVLALGSDGLPAALGLSDGALEVGGQNVFLATAQRIPPRRRPLLNVTVEAAREVLGAEPASILETVLTRIARRAARAKSPDPRSIAGAFAAAPPGDAADLREPGWPPSALPPPIHPGLEGEGSWHPRGTRPAFDNAPPCFYETFLRPDPTDPETIVELVAIDTRQIDLHLEPGVEEPRSLIGLHGAGRPPANVPKERIAAVFTGGQVEPLQRVGDGPVLGFVASRHVLSPPTPGAATIALTTDGRAELGPWPARAELPARLASVRQTSDAILGRNGSPVVPLQHGVERATRSALALLPSGHLVYAWSRVATAPAMARALELLGCSYAVPLGGGPLPSGFAYMEGKAPADHVTPAAPEMSLGPETFASALPVDAFYAVLRSAPPVAALSVAQDAPTWVPDGGRQPTPTWAPAIHSAAVVSLSAQVHLMSFAPGRLSFRIRAGAKEPATRAVTALPGLLAEGERSGLLVAMGLGAGKRRGARGLIIDGTMGLPIRGDEAGVLVVDHGWPRILHANEVPRSGVDAAELPLTADDGKLRPEGRDVGTMRARTVGCSLEDATFVVASTTFDSDEAATTALLNLGCSRVVAFDRGSHHPAFIHRAGTATAPEPRYDPSVLYGFDVVLAGRAGPLN